MRINRVFVLALLLEGMILTEAVRAQETCQDLTRLTLPLPEIKSTTTLDFSSAAAQEPQQTKSPNDSKPPAIDAPKPKSDSPAPVNPNPNDIEGRQPKRILWIIPNYRAVSANTYLPPQSLKEKFWLATEDTFDYSNFILVGMVSGQAMAAKSQPSFGQGGAGYGKYYWHSFADGALENYMVEAIAPSLTKEDPRYYTLGKGGFFKRTGYAMSRLVITPSAFNLTPFKVFIAMGLAPTQCLFEFCFGVAATQKVLPA